MHQVYKTEGSKNDTARISPPSLTFDVLVIIAVPFTRLTFGMTEIGMFQDLLTIS